MASGTQSGSAFEIATFRFDVTPPIGHGCCGGWITPVEHVDDTLEAIGTVLFPPEAAPVRGVFSVGARWSAASGSLS
eukprot:SAG31_NODE_22497_length_524_cov_1.032941_1_plen_76_part_10